MNKTSERDIDVIGVAVEVLQSIVIPSEKKKHTIVYTGYSTSNNYRVLLSTEVQNSMNNLVHTDTLSGFTKYVFDKNSSFIANACLPQGSDSQARVYLYSASGTQKLVAVNMGTYPKPSLIGDAVVGDYLYCHVYGPPSGGAETNFSVLAFEI